MSHQRSLLVIPAVLAVMATAAFADPVVTSARVAIDPSGGLRFSVRGTFDAAEWDQAPSLTVQVGSREEVIPLTFFRRLGNSPSYRYKSKMSGLVRKALVNVERSSFDFTCQSDALNDYKNPLLFSFKLVTRWSFEIPIDETKSVSVFNGLLPGTLDFSVTSFLLVDPALNRIGGPGTTDVPSDARVLIRFSDAVDMTSVNDRTIRIGTPVGGNLFLTATGRFEAVAGHPDEALFDPTFTAGNPGTIPDNPLGFEPDTAYEVRVVSTAETSVTVKSTSGVGVSSSYVANFTTGTGTIHDWGSPKVVRTDPVDNETGVDSSADILVEFDVPIDASTFELGRTMLVENVTTGLGSSLEVLGNLRFSPDLRTVVFRPVLGYGSGPSDIRLRITTDVTSLSGDALEDEVDFTFTTEFDPTQPNFGVVRESFNDNGHEDTAYPHIDPLADWNDPGTPGMLIGALDRSEARSKWYDSGVSNPQYLSAILSPVPADQPAGTSLTVTYQGAPEDPNNPGHPLETAASAWVGDLSSLSGYRFVRFQVQMVASTTDGSQPYLLEIQLPFIYF